MEASLEVSERHRRLFSPGAGELPEPRVGLEDNRLPIIPLHADEHGGRSPVSRDNDRVVLGVVHAFPEPFLEISHGDRLHKRSQ